MTSSATIVSAAAEEARIHGLAFISRAGVARRAGVPSGSLSHYLGGATLNDLKTLVATEHPDLAVDTIDRHEVTRATRDQLILDAALAEARAVGWQQMTRAGVAERAGISAGSVSNYGALTVEDRLFNTMQVIRDDVMAAAVTAGDVALVQQGLAARHPAALDAPADLRERAIRG